MLKNNNILINFYIFELKSELSNIINKKISLIIFINLDINFFPFFKYELLLKLSLIWNIQDWMPIYRVYWIGNYIKLPQIYL